MRSLFSKSAPLDLRYFPAAALLPLLYLFFVSSVHSQTVNRLVSPNGQVTLLLSATHHQLHYSVQYKEQQLTEGAIGFSFGQSQEQIYGSQVQSVERVKIQKKQKHRIKTRGNHNEATLTENQYVYKIKSSTGKTDFWLAVRLYNNGIAYRYSVQSQGRTLSRDMSRVMLPASTRLWWQGDVHQYEGNYSTSTFGALKDSLRLGMPLTLQYKDDLYAAFMEADIFGFAGSHFTHDKKSGSLHYTLAGPVVSRGTDTLHSGWQIMTIATSLNALVNNDIIRDLSETPDRQLFPRGENTDWIRPGQSLWTWMSKKRDVTPENIQKFTDDAALLKIPYNLIDDGWVKWKTPQKDHWQLLKEQVDYAKNKGVGIWVWQAYPPHNGTPGLKDSAYMQFFFKKCAALGIKGMKIDFINQETQDRIAFYERVARAAARYHLMVDFHGANKGTGMEYTYPNILSQEGVRGLEQKDNDHWPTLNTTLPFTRYLSGPADYTPVSFEPYVSSTTLAHQIATAAIFTSPFLCLGADPTELSHSIALPFIRQIPATWDETIVLKASKIGQVAAFARRKGKTWYLAILGGKAPVHLTVDLSFLGRKKYSLKALKDQAGSRETRIVTGKKIKSSDTLDLYLPSGGGYIGILKK